MAALAPGLALGDLEPLELLTRATLLLAAGATLAWALRRRAASVRHRLWTTTFVLLLALPFALLALPAWELPLLPQPAPFAAGNPSRTASVDDPGAALDLPAPAAAETPDAFGVPSANPGRTRQPSRSLPLLLWVAGSATVLMSLLVGALRFAARVRRGRPLRDPAWLAASADLCSRLGIRGEVRLVESSATRTPMTGGWRRAVILLPPSARQWSPRRREVVLTHELVHVRRRDALRQILGGVALALYWFHPLSWLAARLSVVSREQACDETVLDLGARPSEYARHLFDLAAGAPRVATVLSLPLVQRSQLERRIMAILRPSRPHASRATATVVTLSLVAFGLVVALAVPVPQATAAPAAAMSVAAVPAVSAAPAVRSTRTRTCRMEGARGTFSGSLDSDGGRVETSGWHNGDRAIQRYFGDLRLCMRLHGEVVMAADRRAVRAIGSGGWVVLESEEDALRRLVITEGRDGLEYAFTVDGQPRPWDAAARQWQDQMLQVLDLHWQASALRGEKASLRGRIASHRGHVSSLKGQIASHRGHVSSLRGQASSYRGEVSSLKGQIASYQGHVSSLRGQIASHRGQIAGLRAAARGSDNPEGKAHLEAEIARHENQIGSLERQIATYALDARVAEVQAELGDYDVDTKTAEVQRRIDQYDLAGKVAALEREIVNYDLEGKIAALEREIVELDADRRAAQLESQAEPALAELRRLLNAS